VSADIRNYLIFNAVFDGLVAVVLAWFGQWYGTALFIGGAETCAIIWLMDRFRFGVFKAERPR